jgi:hypothetical protein
VNPIYVLSAAVVASATAIVVAARRYSRDVASVVQSSARLLDAALKQHQASLGESLQTNSAALSNLGEAIPSGAAIFTHKTDTSGSVKCDETHTLRFK